jgi:D-aspartate ligase
MQDAREDGVLLTMGTYYGTLAAARCYGRANIPVYLADSDRLTQTRWSRYVDRVVRAPALSELDAFGDWLLSFGKKQPGVFLYSSSDDMSWLLASRLEELSRYFRMYQPPLETIMALLDKRRLYGACRDVGIDVPETYFPDSEASFNELMAKAPVPALIKPRTQMLLDSKLKGQLVRTREDLPSEYRRFRSENTYRPEILAHDPSVSWPMLQRYHAEAMVDTYSLSGFIDQTGRVFVVRGARKVFQRPRQLGIGLCFLGEPVRPELRQKIFDLSRHVGYYGAFEAEFVHVGDGHHLLIDYNPRFYGQMGFEVAREMPLPTFVYHAARGLSGDALRAAVGVLNDGAGAETYHFSNRWVLELVLLTQTLSGRLQRSERRALRAILDDPGARYVDAVRDASDTGPFVADVLINVSHFARHPRDFLRKFFLDA